MHEPSVATAPERPCCEGEYHTLAAPHVTSAVALPMQAFPGSSASEIEDAINNSAQDLGAPGPDDQCGHGLLDVSDAYELLEASAGCTDMDGDNWFVESNCGAVLDCEDYNATIWQTPGALASAGDEVDLIFADERVQGLVVQ